MLITFDVKFDNAEYTCAIQDQDVSGHKVEAFAIIHRSNSVRMTLAMAKKAVSVGQVHYNAWRIKRNRTI